MAIFRIGALIPILAVLCWNVAFYLLYRGLRGAPMLSAPHCARCQYDLRWVNPEVNTACPECGADLKARHAVRFGRYQRRPVFLIVAVGLTLLPFALPMLLQLFYVPSSLVPTASTPTATIISKLATAADQPWNWGELERRLGAGKLSSQEASAAVDQLIKFLEKKPGGYGRPFYWADSFLLKADSARLISNEQFLHLAKAYYGLTTVKMRQRIKSGQPLCFEIPRGESWSFVRLRLIKALRSVRLENGQECRIEPKYNQPGQDRMDQLSAAGYPSIEAKVTLEPALGKDALLFTVDTGLIPDDADFRTGTDKPGQAIHWPKTRCKWTEEITVPIEVIPPDQALVKLVDDPALAPTQNELVISAGLYPQLNGQVLFRLKALSEGLRLPVVGRVTAQIGNRTEDLNVLALLDRPGFRSEARAQFAAPPPEIKTVTLTLTPDPSFAEKIPQVDQIWGKELVFKDIPLERADLETDASAQSEN